MQECTSNFFVSLGISKTVKSASVVLQICLYVKVSISELSVIYIQK